MRLLKPGILALIGAVTIWGSTFVVTKFLMNDIGPLLIIGLRLFISLLALTPFALRRGFRWKMVSEKQYWLYGLTGVTLYFVLSNIGLARSTSANAALIQAAIPAFIAIFSVIFLHEKISGQRAIGICLSIFGVLLVSGMPSPSGDSMLFGNLLILGSIIAWSVYNIQGKKFFSNTDPLAATTASFFTGWFLLLPFVFWEITQTGFPEITPISWLSISYLGIAGSALGYFLWNFGLQSVDASIAGPFINLIPIIGLIFAILVGDQVSLIQITGGLIAIFGVLIAQDLFKFKKGTVHENPGSTD